MSTGWEVYGLAENNSLLRGGRRGRRSQGLPFFPETVSCDRGGRGQGRGQEHYRSHKSSASGDVAPAAAPMISERLSSYFTERKWKDDVDWFFNCLFKFLRTDTDFFTRHGPEGARQTLRCILRCTVLDVCSEEVRRRRNSKIRQHNAFVEDDRTELLSILLEECGSSSERFLATVMQTVHQVIGHVSALSVAADALFHGITNALATVTREKEKTAQQFVRTGLCRSPGGLRCADNPVRYKHLFTDNCDRSLFFSNDAKVLTLFLIAHFFPYRDVAFVLYLARLIRREGVYLEFDVQICERWRTENVPHCMYSPQLSHVGNLSCCVDPEGHNFHGEKELPFYPGCPAPLPLRRHKVFKAFEVTNVLFFATACKRWSEFAASLTSDFTDFLSCLPKEIRPCLIRSLIPILSEDSAPDWLVCAARCGCSRLLKELMLKEGPTGTHLQDIDLIPLERLSLEDAVWSDTVWLVESRLRLGANPFAPLPNTDSGCRRSATIELAANIGNCEAFYSLLRWVVEHNDDGEHLTPEFWRGLLLRLLDCSSGLPINIRDVMLRKKKLETIQYLLVHPQVIFGDDPSVWGTIDGSEHPLLNAVYWSAEITSALLDDKEQRFFPAGLAPKGKRSSRNNNRKKRMTKLMTTITRFDRVSTEERLKALMRTHFPESYCPSERLYGGLRNDPRLLLFVAVVADRDPDLVAYLLAHPMVDPTLRHPANGGTVLHYVGLSVSIAKLLLADKRLDPNATDKYGLTPVAHMMRRRRCDVSHHVLQCFLSDERIDLSQRFPPYGGTLLHLACETAEVLDTLLATGKVDVNARRTHDGKTCLEVWGREGQQLCRVFRKKESRGLVNLNLASSLVDEQSVLSSSEVGRLNKIKLFVAALRVGQVDANLKAQVQKLMRKKWTEKGRYSEYYAYLLSEFFLRLMHAVAKADRDIARIRELKKQKRQ